MIILDCPSCKKDCEEFIIANSISLWSGEFHCPHCHMFLECDADEIWDGENEGMVCNLIKKNKEEQ